MDKEQFIAETLACLDAERGRRPDMQAQDVVKHIFQGLLGVGHLLASPEEVEAYIARETGALAGDSAGPLTAPLSPAWMRLDLGRAKAEGLTPRAIACMMLDSGPVPEFSRGDVAEACRAWAGSRGVTGLDDAILPLAVPDWLPSHSEIYRERYHPAYRVISRRWEPLLPAIGQALRMAAARVLITLDGPCASGKTTLAERLARPLDAAVIHTDHFVVPHERKTAERLAVPGGNCDWERLTAEVLEPWKEGRTGIFRRYDWGPGGLLPPEPLPAQRVMILEGTYCNLPAIRRLADIRLFLDTPAEVRRQRLEARESPASLRMFDQRWIPLENAYYEAYGLPDEGCAVISC